MIVPEVDSEIRRNRTALEAAMQTSSLRQVESMIASDLTLFTRLTRRISAAYASCIVAAKALGADLAVDDRVCRQLAAGELSEQRLTGTEWLLLEAVQAVLITMEEGDRVLHDLVTVKYRPKVQSLRDLES
jgi:predicted nucleic acid-binding protein